ncbi:unnamed protein product [Prorocentrum cordatum]|uniref:Uncharacterized protein n=1 Tax=Prorocentrum cordatum TaxID=2364126 RepID=A0ABN9S4Q2_9DINO|nr:unnamed protein product [Polarella glacialis]
MSAESAWLAASNMCEASGTPKGVPDWVAWALRAWWQCPEMEIYPGPAFPWLADQHHHFDRIGGHLTDAAAAMTRVRSLEDLEGVMKFGDSWFGLSYLSCPMKVSAPAWSSRDGFDDRGPERDESNPVADQSNPDANEGKLVADQSNPDANESKPVTDQSDLDDDQSKQARCRP